MSDEETVESAGFAGVAGKPPAYRKLEIGQQKNIVLVAHDSKKRDLLEWRPSA